MGSGTKTDEGVPAERRGKTLLVQTFGPNWPDWVEGIGLVGLEHLVSSPIA